MIRAGVALREALVAAQRRVLLHDMVGGTRTAKELLDRVEQLAGALIEKGLAGAKIGLWYRNNCAAVEAHLAVEWMEARACRSIRTHRLRRPTLCLPRPGLARCSSTTPIG
jgi:acyl-CoA synthetase (AMP-forming)/AMP-acid ligase II